KLAKWRLCASATLSAARGRPRPFRSVFVRTELCAGNAFGGGHAFRAWREAYRLANFWQSQKVSLSVDLVDGMGFECAPTTHPNKLAAFRLLKPAKPNNDTCE
ncbi:MAG: hypothetical protein ACJ72H_18625, partial [Candidatus Sulfotelmatobacter sp.]